MNQKPSTPGLRRGKNANRSQPSQGGGSNLRYSGQNYGYIDSSNHQNSHNVSYTNNSADYRVDQSQHTTNTWVYQMGSEYDNLESQQRRYLHLFDAGCQQLKSDYLAIHELMEEFQLDLYLHAEAMATAYGSDEREWFDLEQCLDGFLAQDTRSVATVCLLHGSAGSGKSTFNHHLARKLWRNYDSAPDRESATIPLFIPLGSLSVTEKDNYDLIAAYFRKQGFTDQQMSIAQKERRFVFILDGYDEIETRERNFYNDNNIGDWTRNGSKVIITSRPEYLCSGYAFKFHPRGQGQLLQEYWLAPFSPKRIDEYILRYTRAKGTDVSEYQHLVSRPEVQALISNPFLLRMAMDVAPVLTTNDLLTRGMLYDEFIQHWFRKAQERLYTVQLSPTQRQTFEILCQESFTSNVQAYCQRFALALYKYKALEACYDATGSDLIKNQQWREFLTHDDRTRLLRFSSPLLRMEQSYRFLHKSLRDYFVAQSFWNDDSLKQCQATANLNKFCVINDHGVIDFVIERARKYTDLQHQLLAYIKQSTLDATVAQGSANAITVLVRAGVRFTQYDLSGTHIPGADLSYGWFEKSNLRNSDLRQVRLYGAWLHAAELCGARMDDVELVEKPVFETNSMVFDCRYSPDGQLLALGSDDNTILLWSAIRQQVVFAFRGHRGRVNSVAFSPDGQLLASGSDDSTIQLWSVTQEEPVFTFKEHTSGVLSVAFSPNGQLLASGSNDSTTLLWSVTQQQPILTFKEDKRRVGRVTFSSDSQLLALGSDDGTIRLWSVTRQLPVHIFEGDTCSISSVAFSRLAFSPDGELALTWGSDDNTIRLWSVTQQQLVFAFKVPPVIIFPPIHDPPMQVYDQQGPKEYTIRVRNVAVSPDGKLLVLGSDGGTICLWSVTRQNPVHIFEEDARSINSMAFSFDGHLLALGGNDGRIRLWSVSQQQPVFTFEGDTGRVKSVAFSLDGQLLASSSDCRGSDGSTIWLWSVTKRQLVHIFEGDKCGVISVAFSPDHQLLASGSDDGTIRLWSVTQQQPVFTFREKTRRVHKVAFSSDSQLLALGSEDSTILVWSMTRQLPVHIFKEDTCSISSVAFSPDRQLLASGSDDGTIRLWSVIQQQSVFTFSGHTNRVRSVAFSPDGQLLVSGSDDSTIRLRSVTSQLPVHMFQGDTGSIIDVAFSPSGQLLASGSDDRTERAWSITRHLPVHILEGHTQWLRSLNQQQPAHTFEAHTSSVDSVPLSPNGPVVAFGTSNTILLWSVTKQQLVHIFEGHRGWVRSVVFSPDGQLLASGSDDRTIRLWSLTQQKLVFTFTGHITRILSVAFSPDGQLLASGSDDSTIRLWSVTQQQPVFAFKGHTSRSPTRKQPLFIFKGHTSGVRSVAFSPDHNGHLLASGSDDKTIRLWSPTRQKLVFTFRGHTSRVHIVAFSPDGQLLASVGVDKTVRLWSIASRCAIVAYNYPVIPGAITWIPADAHFADDRLAISSHDGILRVCSVSKNLSRLRNQPSVDISCDWATSQIKLNLIDTRVNGATGLSPRNIRLLEQNGAMLKPSSPLYALYEMFWWLISF